ncbi:MAG: DUF1549 domain-containing protein [Pirellulaceae bacterium]|nr:DUF1549 domain-containing protein [Pirellulaceae bacterium]
MLLRWTFVLVWLSLAGWPLVGWPSILLAAELLPADRSPEEVIDYYIDARIREAGITAAPTADDATLIRRTMLDLAGRTPTVWEVQAYVASDDPAKRQELVERLLASPEFVRHQATEFDTLLMNGNQGSLREYLEQAFQEQRGWDRMFRDLLAGQPAVESPEADGSKLASAAHSTRFLLSRINDLDKLASEASSLFFGVNVSCAQCHDHPLVPDWTQDHFYGMKSFFSRSFENGGFLGERDYGLINYKTVEGEARDARLMFLTGTVVEEPPDRTLTDQEQKDEKQQLDELKKQKQPPPPPAFSRREQLVDVALRPEERHYFSRAIVNRLWYRFFGRGLVMPLDQMHPENPPSHPELLDWLARDLVGHDYDLTRLVRSLVLSQAYARGSQWNPTSEPPAADLFAVAEVRPLTPAQYAVVLRMATSNPDQWGEQVSADDRQKRVDQVVGAARGLVSLFEQPGPDFQVGVAEALLLSNSQRIERELLRDASDSLLGKLKQLDDRSQQVATAIWNIYGRAPTDEEQRVLEEFLAERQEAPVEGCRQLVWALLCSSPCRFNY